MPGPDYRYTLRGLTSARQAGASRHQRSFGSLVVDLDAEGHVLGVENWGGSITIDNLMAVLNHCVWADRSP